MAQRRLAIVILLCFCLCLMPQYVQAASTSDAKAPVAPDQQCQLTIYYRCDEIAVAEQTVSLYQIATVSADFQYTPSAPFAAAGLVLNGVQSSAEWNTIRNTLEAYILGGNITPAYTETTDAAGQVCFAGLQPGLYLASAVSTETCFFDSSLISLPGLGADGLWQYEVAVTPKPEILPPVEPDAKLSLKVLKLWKGEDANRPKSVQVEIFRNGSSYETVTLSEENNWCYSWTAPDDGASWNVVERNVPEGYRMTVEGRGDTFVITNTLTSENPATPPQTGDSANIGLYSTLMYVSGAALILLGIAGKRKRNEETN